MPDWEADLAPHLDHVSASPDPREIPRQWLLKSASETTEDGDVLDDEEEGEDLCNCTFSLAYGAKILLNTATLRLKRGHRYGLFGRDGSGQVCICSSCVVEPRGVYIVRVCTDYAQARHHQIPRGSSHLLHGARYRWNREASFGPLVHRT